MKKSMKPSVRIAICLCIVGVVLWVVSAIAEDSGKKNLSTVTYETNTYKIEETFSNITIETKTADICFAPWEEEGCKIVCYEETKMKHTVAVQEDKLTIAVKDTREWYDNIGISFEKAKLTVYLPKEQYKMLEIKSSTGDVDVPVMFGFQEVRVQTTTGKINWKASVADSLTIKSGTGEVKVDTEKLGKLQIETTTGEVSVSSVTNALMVGAKTTTGKILLDSIRCRSFSADSNTGKIRIKNTVADFNATVTSNTGGVTFEKSDAQESLCINTTTGDVKGTLLSEKSFYTKTTTGKISVPKTVGNPCEITTTTGDIEIEVIGD